MRITLDQMAGQPNVLLKDYVGHYVLLAYLGEEDPKDQYRAARLAASRGSDRPATVPSAQLAAIARFGGSGSPVECRIVGQTLVYPTVLADNLRRVRVTWGKLVTRQGSNGDRSEYYTLEPIEDPARATEVLRRFQTLWPEDNDPTNPETEFTDDLLSEDGEEG